MSNQQGFPQISSPLVDLRTGQVNQTWLQLFIAMWTRTGGAVGNNVTSVAVVPQNGIIATVSNPTSTVSIALGLGNITPVSVDAHGTIFGSNLTGTNTGDVTLTGENYLSLAGQQIDAEPIDLTGTNVTGQLKGASFPVLTGDVTSPGASLATTLKTVNSSVGSFSAANITVNAKGLITAASNGSSGAAITALTSDVTATGPGSAAATLATVNANVGTFQGITVNGKGLVTAASNQSYLTANQTITASGDATGSGTTSLPLTLATVNVDVGTYTAATVTVNAKGLVTAAVDGGGISATIITAALTALGTQGSMTFVGGLLTAQVPAT